MNKMIDMEKNTNAKDNEIKVSIICSAWNREDYIEQCVESILAQSLKDIEVILIDNGSSDKTGNMIDAFALKDDRVKVIHNPKGTSYGKALNQGVALSRGECIGIVESDDWIDPTMYEKLYAKLKQYNADVSICSFTRVLPSRQPTNEYKLLEFAPKDKVFSIDENPRMWYMHPSIWAKIYKRQLIEKIGFDEEEPYLDQPFIAKLFSESRRFVCVPEYLYFYRQNNENASSAVAKKDKSMVRIVHAFQKVKHILKEKGLYDKFKEHTYYHATYVIKGWLERIDDKHKKFFQKEAYKYYRELKKDKDFSYKFFNTKEQTFVKAILQKRWDAYKYDRYDEKCFWGIPYVKFLGEGNRDEVKILGLKVKQTEKKDKITVRYLGGLFQREKFEFYDEYRIFKMLLFKKFYIDKFIQHSVDMSNKINLVFKQELKRALEVCMLHQRVFPQFRNLHRKEDIVVCGAGPSLSAYKPMPKCIHIGVNRVFRHPRIALDYVFFLDYNIIKGDAEKIAHYRVGQCKKFFGQLLEQNHPFFIPDGFLPNEDVYRYWVDDSNFNFDENFNYDLSTCVLPCFFSVIFQAISFALWAHPKRLFLVGCDANFAGHFDGSPMASSDKHWEYLHRTRNFDGWHKLTSFLKVYYPDVEVISINPVGLKGMFNDVYTEDYLELHPELPKSKLRILKYTEN